MPNPSTDAEPNTESDAKSDTKSDTKSDNNNNNNVHQDALPPKQRANPQLLHFVRK